MNLNEKACEILQEEFWIESSKRDIEDFTRSPIWRDIQRCLSGSLENIRDELETMGAGTGYAPEEIPYAMAFYQGQAFLVRFMQDIPAMLLTLQQEDEDEPDRP